MGYVKANRAQSMQSKILHKSSRIECVLQFDTKAAYFQLQQTMEIIVKFMTLHPMCKFISFFLPHLAKNFYDNNKYKFYFINRQTANCLRQSMAKYIE